MAAFDPYHKWLGIPPADQPANHYRLLGLNLFESDPDVIDVATEQRVVYLRQCATGQHIVESQKLLNEVATARLCLLNAQKKREYDQRLRQSLAAAQVPVQSTEPAPVMMPWESPSDEQPDAVTAAVVQSPKRGDRVAHKNSLPASAAFTGKRIAVASGPMALSLIYEERVLLRAMGCLITHCAEVRRTRRCSRMTSGRKFGNGFGSKGVANFNRV